MCRDGCSRCYVCSRFIRRNGAATDAGPDGLYVKRLRNAIERSVTDYTTGDFGNATGTDGVDDEMTERSPENMCIMF